MKFTTQQFEQTLKALQYIEDHLTDPICIEDISTHVNYSLFHFSRVFNAVTMISPYTFLMRRRITEAANQVINTHRRLTDIAMDYGFQSSEVFSRSFRRLFNTSPSDLRKQKYIDSRQLLPAISANQLQNWQRFRSIPLQKDEWQPSHAFGIQTRSTETTAILEKTRSEIEQQVSPPANQTLLSVLYFPEQWESQGSYIFSGLQTEQPPQHIPPWFVEKQIPDQFALSTKADLPIADVAGYLAYLSAVWFPISSYHPVYPFVICVHQNKTSTVKLYIPVRSKEDHFT
jgi:AraC family transcriptional regulator